MNRKSSAELNKIDSQKIKKTRMSFDKNKLVRLIKDGAVEVLVKGRNKKGSEFEYCLLAVSEFLSLPPKKKNKNK